MTFKLGTRKPKYFGKVCSWHPAANGERYDCGACVACSNRKPRLGTRPSFPWKKAQDGGYRFYHGTICRRDPEHGTRRYVNTGACIQCVKAVAKKTKKYVKTGWAGGRPMGHKLSEETKLRISLALRKRRHIDSLHADTGYANG